MKDARELFPPSPKRIPAAPMMVVENVSDENATPEFFTTDEIVAGLTAGDAATRIAARLAAQQSGDRNFIGALQSAAETVADAKEKTMLLAAADFLILPTLTETLAGQ